MKKKIKETVRRQSYMSHKGCDCLTPIPDRGLTCGRESNCEKHNNVTDKVKFFK